MEISKRWYALYTKPYWEKRVSDSLTKKHIENYCPFNKVNEGSKAGKKNIETPLFASYVFVHSDNYKIIPVSSISGLINFAYWLKYPVIIPDVEIASIRSFLGEFKNIHVERMQIRSNNVASIVERSHMNQSDQLNSSENNSLKVHLPTIGYIMHSNIRVSEFEPNVNKEFSNYFDQRIKYALR
jgi:transcription antitermination factor NusG